ncbi:MAG: tRNA (guanosine(37)-N1)-methyltransferase TrmD [Candidatus Pacebacteria bacterium]|nr:tRNA (guanosine(37)-N1)-methyltransferase TrmD [Candidatus Paceibacterota bacterium]
MKNFHIITLFPDAFDSYLGESIIKRARDDGKIKIKFYNPRDFTGEPDKRKNRRIDQRPYGGGPGMVIQALPVLKAVQSTSRRTKKKQKIILLSPRGKQFTNEEANKLAKSKSDIVLISGRYEGIDARVKKILKPTEYSVGPYTLTGGELPAMILIDAISRRIKGVLGDEQSVEENRIAGADVYTRPEILTYKKKKYRVPKVLLSGHHKKIDEWREGKK